MKIITILLIYGAVNMKYCPAKIIQTFYKTVACLMRLYCNLIKHLFFNFRKTAMPGKKILFHEWKYLSFEKKNKPEQNYLLFFSVLSILIDRVILFGLWFQNWDLCKFCVERNLISHCLVFLVVYHLQGQTGWSTVYANGKESPPEWEIPFEISMYHLCDSP